MPALVEGICLPKAAIHLTAKSLAAQKATQDETVKKHCVCINSTIQAFLEAAKAPDQTMPEFLRECALTVSLQKLQDSQI